jgi:hypothetical protein
MADTNDERLDLSKKRSSIPEAAPAQLPQIQTVAQDKANHVVLDKSASQEPRDVEQGQNNDPAEPPPDQPLQAVQSAGEDYSVLTVRQKRITVMAASLASLFSPMATAIYCQFPIFNLITEKIDFNRSLPRYYIQRPKCHKHENQHHDHSFLGISLPPFHSKPVLTFTGRSRNSPRFRG